jgi:hypothetical protein
VQDNPMATSFKTSPRLQELSAITASFSNTSTARQSDIMADGNTSAISPSAPGGDRGQSTVESAGFIAGVVIGVVLALAVLVALVIFLRRKLNSSRTVQPPGKIIVRFGPARSFKEREHIFFTRSSAGV